MTMKSYSHLDLASLCRMYSCKSLDSMSRSLLIYKILMIPGGYETLKARKGVNMHEPSDT